MNSCEGRTLVYFCVKKLLEWIMVREDPSPLSLWCSLPQATSRSKWTTATGWDTILRSKQQGCHPMTAHLWYYAKCIKLSTANEDVLKCLLARCSKICGRFHIDCWMYVGLAFLGRGRRFQVLKLLEMCLGHAKKQPSTSWISTSAPQARQSSDSTPGKKFTSLTSNFVKSNHLEKISLSAIQHLGSRDVTISTNKYNSSSLYWNS